MNQHALRSSVADTDELQSVLASCRVFLAEFAAAGNVHAPRLVKRIDALLKIKPTPSAITLTWKQQDADMLAAAVDAAILRGSIDSRSEIADCRLDYGKPFSEKEIKRHLSKRRHGKRGSSSPSCPSD
jgi:hypothetical protein